MNSEINDLARALQNSIKEKNTLTVQEFKPFHPLFKKDSDKTTDAYRDLCVEWACTVSLYDPVNIIDPSDGNKIIKVLPPSFTKVDTLNPNHADAAIGKFRQASATNHPLRTDVEEATELLKAVIHHSQNHIRIEEACEQFAKISKEAGFDNPDILEADNRKVLDQLEWTDG